MDGSLMTVTGNLQQRLFFFFFFFLMKAKQTAYNNKYTTYNASTLLT